MSPEMICYQRMSKMPVDNTVELRVIEMLCTTTPKLTLTDDSCTFVLSPETGGMAET